MDKLRKLDELAAECGVWRGEGKRIVWTNGCFDLFHAGHARALEVAKSFGDVLVVGINSDRSVRELKGANRPLCGEADRATMLSALSAVDRVVVFDGKRCDAELRRLRPDVWTKSGDYTVETLDAAEREAVLSYGGRIEITPLIPGISTTLLVKKILRRDPEKIISAACGFIRDASGRLLLVASRYDEGVRWGLPGGGHERGESLPDAMRREVLEETGLRVEAGRHMGVIERIDPARSIHLVMHVFEAIPRDVADVSAFDFSARSDEYVVDAAWFDPERMHNHPGVVMGRRLWLEHAFGSGEWPAYSFLLPGEE